MRVTAHQATTVDRKRSTAFSAPGLDIRGRLACAGLLLLAACTSDFGTGTTGGSGPTRSYRMGFSPFPPKNDQSTVLPTLELWTRRADAGIMHVGIPWAALLAGSPAAAEVQSNQVGLAQYYRGKGLAVLITLDLTDGLNRSAEAPELVAARRSLSEPAVQLLYRQYVDATASLVHPDYLGLAAETNLIRAVAPRSLYDAVVKAAADAAPDVHPLSAATRLFVSVQVETAWGLLPQAAGYVGIADDLRDFPYVQALGLSTYPYAAWPDPDQLPLDYYQRIPGASGLPVMVVEGGWTSASVSTVVSSPEKQARYLRRQARLLDAAAALFVFGLDFADLDLSTFPPPLPPGISFFASLGLVDSNLNPKPALAVYDSLFSLRRR